MLNKTKYIKWPNGGSQPLMSVLLSNTEVEQFTNQKLIEGSDDDFGGLGKWIGLGGDLPSGQPVEFLKHLEGPNLDEFVINIDIEANVKEVAKEIFSHLKLPHEKITWQREEIENT